MKTKVWSQVCQSAAASLALSAALTDSFIFCPAYIASSVVHVQIVFPRLGLGYNNDNSKLGTICQVLLSLSCP